MKKFNTRTAVLILISSMIYATLTLGKTNTGSQALYSGSDRNKSMNNLNPHEDTCVIKQGSNITNKALLYIAQWLNLN